MKIEQLTIENFKCFKREQTFDFGRLTVLTGANSSGKSSVIYAILMALQTEVFPWELSPNGNYVNLGDFREIVNGHDINKKFSIGLKDNFVSILTKWEIDKINLLPTNCYYRIERGLFNYVKEYYGNKYIDIVIDFFDIYDYNEDFIKEINQLVEELKNTSLQNNLQIELLENFKAKFKYIDIETYMANPIVKRLNSKVGSRFNRLILNEADSKSLLPEEYQNMNYISTFRQSPQRTYLEKNKAYFKISTEGEGYIDQIVEWEKRTNGKIKQLIKLMKELDLIDDIKINRLGGGRFEVLVQPINSSGFSALKDVGSSVSAFMPILVADLQLTNGSTLFLSEPETHLHPTIQAKFADYIIHQINTTDKNYVIETHSEYFLNRIRLAIVKGELQQSKLSVYFLENNPQDADVYKVEFTKTGGIRNAPDNFFETYSMDVMDIALNSFAE